MVKLCIRNDMVTIDWKNDTVKVWIENDRIIIDW